MMANFQYFDVAGQGFWQDEYTVFSIMDKLFGVPLYAWYIVELDLFEDGIIQGMLTTAPFTIHGPYETRKDAMIELRSLMDSLSMDSQPS